MILSLPTQSRTAVNGMLSNRDIIRYTLVRSQRFNWRVLLNILVLISLLFGRLASDTWHIGTILEWILMALLSVDRQECRCAFSPQPSSIHAFSHHGKQEE